jgi:hypothetical protein
VPAAAVIPAPIAYTKVVAVKKLVVGFRSDYLRGIGLPGWCVPTPSLLFIVGRLERLLTESLFIKPRLVYFEKIRVFKAGYF